MPKLDTDTQYHVSLRSPMRIKLESVSTQVFAFDANVYDRGDMLQALRAHDQGGASVLVFSPHRVWALRAGEPKPSVVSMRATLIVPVDNIAGIVVQPFGEGGR